jgi:hypothetical protein
MAPEKYTLHAGALNWYFTVLLYKNNIHVIMNLYITDNKMLYIYTSPANIQSDKTS